MAPPIQPRVMTAQRPRAQQNAAQAKVAAPSPQRRKQALAASAAIVLIGAVALLSLGGTSDTGEKVAEQPVDKTSNATIVVSD